MVMLRALYDWTMRLGESRYSPWALAFVAFIESSIFPIPPDVLLIPMILAARQRAWTYATICLVASVVGGFGGYMIGFVLFEGLGRPILDFYHYTEQFGRFTELYNQWGAWSVAFFGVTPFPYKVVTIASGVARLDPFVFGFASAVSRGIRFFAVAALLWYFGPPIRAFIERRLGLMAIVFFVLLFGAFVVLKFAL